MSFLNGNEWIILLIIVLLIFGPKKLPELARGIGKALYEFKRASQGLIEEEEESKARRRSVEVVSESKTSTSGVSDEELIRRLAEKLGIETEGKSTEELRREVIEKARELEEKEAKAATRK